MLLAGGEGAPAAPNNRERDCGPGNGCNVDLMLVMLLQPPKSLASAANAAGRCGVVRMRQGWCQTPSSSALGSPRPAPCSRSPVPIASVDSGHPRFPPGDIMVAMVGWWSQRDWTPGTSGTSVHIATHRAPGPPGWALPGHSGLLQAAELEQPHQGGCSRDWGGHWAPASCHLLDRTPQPRRSVKQRRKEGKTQRKLEALEIVKNQHCSSK